MAHPESVLLPANQERMLAAIEKLTDAQFRFPTTVRGVEVEMVEQGSYTRSDGQVEVVFLAGPHERYARKSPIAIGRAATRNGAVWAAMHCVFVIVKRNTDIPTRYPVPRDLVSARMKMCENESESGW